MDSKTLAATVAKAVTLASCLTAADLQAQQQGKEKCYGVAMAGENGCASADGKHSCGGLSTIDFSGQEWMLVEAGGCEKLGGKLAPFEGIGSPPAPQTATSKRD